MRRQLLAANLSPPWKGGHALQIYEVSKSVLALLYLSLLFPGSSKRCGFTIPRRREIAASNASRPSPPSRCTPWSLNPQMMIYLALRLEPVFDPMAGLAATRFKDFVSPAADKFRH
jgi:hypothetical protein